MREGGRGGREGGGRDGGERKERGRGRERGEGERERGRGKRDGGKDELIHTILPYDWVLFN